MWRWLEEFIRAVRYRFCKDCWHYTDPIKKMPKPEHGSYAAIQLECLIFQQVMCCKCGTVVDYNKQWVNNPKILRSK